ncbi:MAG: GFA family protein, partial [Gammaproteobacteria bacterium]
KSMYYCHCSMCRKASGSSFATNMLMKESDLVFKSGENYIKGFNSSPGETRYFCSECGSPIYGKAESRKGLVSLRCGGLDGAPAIQPEVHLFTDWKAPWYQIADTLRQVPDLKLPIRSVTETGQN